MTTFLEIGLDAGLAELLRQQGITEMTTVQEKTIPVLRSGKNAVVKSKTGTGKTLAFLLPILEKVKKDVPVTQALIISPTRELAMQTAKVLARLEKELDISSLLICGGQDIERQKERLRRHPQIIVGTPGRLLDHLRRRTIDISQVNKLVIDEADEMLKLGFIEDVEILIKSVAKDTQLALFSATIPDRVKSLAHAYMKNPVDITVKSEQETLENIEQMIVDATEENKLDKLCEYINEQRPYLAMVFCATKERVSKLALKLAERGYLADELQGDLTQSQRTMVLNKFRDAKLQILVATDIAARGLDIDGVTHVYNYDLPRSTEDYIHRIGRTGRAGREGTAVTFVTARQYTKLRQIESGIRARIQKQKSERTIARERRQQEIRAKILKERKEEKDKKKPLSKYANRKGAEHKGRNNRSRRQKGGVKTNLNSRSKLGGRRKSRH